jgi:hypothetical protein
VVLCPSSPRMSARVERIAGSSSMMRMRAISCPFPVARCQGSSARAKQPWQLATGNWQL